jgi:hypothetical protein
MNIYSCVFYKLYDTFLKATKNSNIQKTYNTVITEVLLAQKVEFL